MIIATVRRAPSSIPGKKPASTAATGKSFWCFSELVVVSAEVCAAPAGLPLVEFGLLVVEADVEVGLDVEVAGAVEDGLAEEEAAACMTQLPLEQLKPFGQHVFVPHV